MIGRALVKVISTLRRFDAKSINVSNGMENKIAVSPNTKDKTFLEFGENISDEIKEAKINDIMQIIPKESDYSLDLNAFIKVDDFLSIKQI